MLASIRSPSEVKWSDKEKRIRLDYAREKDAQKGKGYYFDEKQFHLWKQNVELKFKLTTDKVQLEKPFKQDLPLNSQIKRLSDTVNSLRDDIIKDKTDRDFKAWFRKPFYYALIALVVSFVLTYLIYYFYYRVDGSMFFRWLGEKCELTKEFSVKGAVEIVSKCLGFIFAGSILIWNSAKKHFNKEHQENKKQEIANRYFKEITDNYGL